MDKVKKNLNKNDGKSFWMSSMKTNADKDLKQQLCVWEGEKVTTKPGVNIKQNKKMLVCIKHTSYECFIFHTGVNNTIE